MHARIYILGRHNLRHGQDCEAGSSALYGTASGLNQPLILRKVHRMSRKPSGSRGQV